MNQSIFASDLGWPVGQFPVSVQHEGISYLFHNKTTGHEGAVVAWVYEGSGGNTVTVTVYND